MPKALIITKDKDDDLFALFSDDPTRDVTDTHFDEGEKVFLVFSPKSEAKEHGVLELLNSLAENGVDMGSLLGQLIQAVYDKVSTEKERNEIAFKIVKSLLREKGIKMDSLKRDIPNEAKKLGIAEEKYALFVKELNQEVFEEMFKDAFSR